MNIGLDYDGTFTSAPALWLNFVYDAKARGHKIWVVTMRYPSEGQDMDPTLRNIVEGVIYTERQAKGPWVARLGIAIHIWIDDNPQAVHMNALQIWGTSSAEGDVHVPSHD